MQQRFYVFYLSVLNFLFCNVFCFFSNVVKVTRSYWKFQPVGLALFETKKPRHNIILYESINLSNYININKGHFLAFRLQSIS